MQTQKPSLIMVVPTLRCDHDCMYCQVSRAPLTSKKHDLTLTPEVIADAIDQIAAPNFKLEFQGGEPLLNFEMVKYIVLEAKKRNLSLNRNLQFVIATTMSLITDEILDFCKEHKIIISSSFVINSAVTLPVSISLIIVPKGT